MINFDKKTILITGSRGYLGQAIQKALGAYHCHLIRLARPGSHFPTLDGLPSYENIAGDISDPHLWETVLPRTDIIFHLAAQTSVTIANRDPYQDWEANLKPLLVMLESCKKLAKKPIIIFASTCALYGNPPDLPVDESYSSHPLSMYELHKHMAEQYLLYYTQQNIVDAVNLRLANVYGGATHATSQDRGIINQMIKKALKLEPLTIYGEGQFLRDYIYIDDVVNAFLAAAFYIPETSGNTYIISSGERYTLADAIYLIAEKVSQLLSHQVPVIHTEPPSTLTAVDTRNFIGNNKKFLTAASWHPEVNLSQGLDKTILQLYAASNELNSGKR